MMQPPPSPANMTLPPPGYPMVTRVLSNALFPPEAPAVPGVVAKEEPVAWVLTQPHPFVPTMQIVRMFVVRGGGVEIYSVSADGSAAIRNLLPMHWVRFVEEAMPLEVFVEELALAEAGGDDDEPELPDPNSGLPSDPDTTANGQAGSSV